MDAVRPPEPFVAFDDVRLSYGRPVLRGVSFELPPGHTKIILGASGSGKTTILRLILGLIRPDSGSIRVEGEEITGLDEEALREIRLRIGMVFQEGALFDSLSVGENVGYRLIEDRIDAEEVEARISEMLAAVGLGGFADRRPGDLSGGQRRRVAVARALAARPDFMLYDEPTTGLDPITATTITDLIAKVRDLYGVTSILVTHQLRDAFNVARTRIREEAGRALRETRDELLASEETGFMMLRDGSLVFEGTAAELRESDDAYVREFLE
jgi:phospholipid/cholesterol/gamma-HCH transport system ATP-binding protein